VRSTRRVELTPAGEALLVDARRLVADADLARRRDDPDRLVDDFVSLALEIAATAAASETPYSAPIEDRS
jgi:DNA-binding transcriptional LysR family regulator